MKLRHHLLVSIRLTLLLAVVTGLIYPLVMTGVAQGLFRHKANGSLVSDKSGTVVGSSLIGQCFYETTLDKSGNRVDVTTKDDQGNTIFAIDPHFFQSRPSFTVDANGNPLPCNAANSTGSNLAPSNPALISRVKGYTDYLRSMGVAPNEPMPVDLVTGDFTGFDPDITEAAALAQVDMVARARHWDPAVVRRHVEANVEGRVLGIFGEPHVNVLALNMSLEGGGAPN